MNETRRPEAHARAIVKLGSIGRGKADGDPKARSSCKQAHSAETTNHARYIDKGDTGHVCSEGSHSSLLPCRFPLFDPVIYWHSNPPNLPTCGAPTRFQDSPPE